MSSRMTCIICIIHTSSELRYICMYIPTAHRQRQQHHRLTLSTGEVRRCRKFFHIHQETPFCRRPLMCDTPFPLRHVGLSIQTQNRFRYHGLLYWMIPLSVVTSLGMSWRSSHSHNNDIIHDIDDNYHHHHHNSNDGHDHDSPWSSSSYAAGAAVSFNRSGGSGGGSMTMPFVDPSAAATTTSSTLSSWWYGNNNNHDDDPDEDEMTTVTTTPTATTTTTSITDTATWIMVAPPEFTTHIVLPNETERATEYYRSNLNEERGEIWLHRGFVRLKPKMQLEEKEQGRRRRLDDEENDNERRRRKRPKRRRR